MGGELYAFSDMIDHMTLLGEFYSSFQDSHPGIAGLEDCGCPFYHPKKTKVAEKYLARHSLGAQQPLGSGDLVNAYWLPGLGNPADGLTNEKAI